jgi:hypothetical protein
MPAGGGNKIVAELRMQIQSTPSNVVAWHYLREENGRSQAEPITISWGSIASNVACSGTNKPWHTSGESRLQ